VLGFPVINDSTAAAGGIAIRSREPESSHFIEIERQPSLARIANMKMLSTLLTAAIIACGSTAAMAQTSGPDTTARPGMPQGADDNPSVPGANPAAGNPDGAPGAGQPGMTTAPVAGRPGRPASQPNAQGPLNAGGKTNGGTGGGERK
jgi:hypothetical protein